MKRKKIIKYQISYGISTFKKKVSNDTFFYIWLKNQQFLGKVEARVQSRYRREVNMLPYMPSQCELEVKLKNAYF